ncbi:MAG TPA: ribosome maturation factor RimP [Micromonosporaceae bacterium]
MARRDRTAGRRPGDAPSRPRGDLVVHRDRLRAVVEPVVRHTGYDLEELVLSRAGRRHLLRVVVDGDGGVSLDDIATVSRAVSAALDAAEETGGEFVTDEYLLEVSSPGVDRPLTLPRHWRRNVGRLVRVTVQDRQLTARIAAADDERVTLDVAGQARDLPYVRLGPGRVQVEFTRPDEVGDDELDEIDDEEVEDEER